MSQFGHRLVSPTPTSSRHSPGQNENMAIVERSTELANSADAVWFAVKTPAAFRRVTRRLLLIPAIRSRSEPWREGETVVGWVFLLGFLPFSRHHLHVHKVDDASRTLSSREHGGLIKRCNHDIGAGIFTPFVVLYARWFYAMRQRRWRELAKELPEHRA